jgi:hypothetical protein
LSNFSFQNLHDFRTITIPTFEENRKKLFGLILELNKFTLEELQNKCDEANIGIFDSSQSIQDLLDALVYHGFLKVEWGIYTVNL